MAIPTLQGTDHIGFTVPDIEKATEFFVEVIGCEFVYSLGPFSSEGDWMERHLNVHPRTVMKEIRFFRCGSGSNFELFEYKAPDGQKPQPRNSDIGGHHLAFYVDDFDQAVEYLRDKDVEILGTPTNSKNASEGQRWVYFLAPWGMQMELVSFPEGKHYERDSQVLLWHPKFPEK